MVTKGNISNKNFVQEMGPSSLPESMPKITCKKKRIRRFTDPRIESYKAGGYTYYRFRRGIDSPEHLGTADFILKSVTFYRKHIREAKCK